MDFKEIISYIKECHGNRGTTPLHAPIFQGNEKKYLADTIDSSFVSSVGAYVNRAEEMLAHVAGVEKVAAVVNGTSALQVSLRLAGVQSGDEVITQALTFVATTNAIAYNGAIPVFVDVDIDTMGLSPKALGEFLEQHGELRENGCYNKGTGRKISACVPMHTFGFMCEMDDLSSVCSKWRVPVVEDAAEALGCKYKGKAAGSLGDLGVYSFNGNKVITSGGGGAIVAQKTDLVDQAKYLTTTAKVPHKWEYLHDKMGYNFRLPNVNAALLCAQLEQLDTFIASKRGLYEQYSLYFKGKGLNLKPIPTHTEWNYWLVSVELEDRKEQQAFLKSTNEKGVMTRPIWQLMYRLPMYATCQRDGQENAQFLEERIVNIPSSARKA